MQYVFFGFVLDGMGIYKLRLGSIMSLFSFIMKLKVINFSETALLKYIIFVAKIAKI